MTKEGKKLKGKLGVNPVITILLLLCTVGDGYWIVWCLMNNKIEPLFLAAALALLILILWVLLAIRNNKAAKAVRAIESRGESKAAYNEFISKNNTVIGGNAGGIERMAVFSDNYVFICNHPAIFRYDEIVWAYVFLATRGNNQSYTFAIHGKYGTLGTIEPISTVSKTGHEAIQTCFDVLRSKVPECVFGTENGTAERMMAAQQANIAERDSAKSK